MTAPTYTIDFTDINVDQTKRSFKIAPGELNSSSTSLRLPGAGYAPYGEPIAEDLIRLLENFASFSPPTQPTIGQLWFDANTKLLKVLTAITPVGSSFQYTWTIVGSSILISITEPVDTSRLWYDTSSGNPANHQLKIFNAIAGLWQPVVPGSLVVSGQQPTSTSSIWYNVSSPQVSQHELYVFNPITQTWKPGASRDASLIVGNIPDDKLTTSNIGGNAATATLAASALKLATGRTITLTNGVFGATVFDGSADVTIQVTAINANVLTFGTVPVDRLGLGGTRAAGYYLAGNNIWTQMPSSIDAYTKVEVDNMIAPKVNGDGASWVGFASNDPAYPYMRRTSDNTVYYLQPRLQYTPAPLASTLAGYGITDAYTKAQIDALIPPAVDGNLASSGWTKLSNGLILQWGRFTGTGKEFYANPNYITLPVSFPNQLLFASSTPDRGNGVRWESFMDFARSTTYQLGIYDNYPGGLVTWFAVGF